MSYGAAAAAAARRQRLEEEEEEMTNYSSNDLNQYEFKIVRANWYPFRSPVKFKNLLEEEARAGWELVEKLDDRRVRFKRPISARQGDNLLAGGIDPYRTRYGIQPLLFILLIILIVFLTISVIFGLMGVLNSLTYR